ncbi:MAG: HPr-rel-A system PqqD family peptide chaperone [Herminiimonas sp.]|nr:HPr-rel-A system PqqD family peptide chaperone [Herminiimonas sp.]
MLWRTIRDDAILFCPLEDEVVIYDALSGDTHVIDATAAQILQALQQSPSDVTTLAQLLARQLQCETGDALNEDIEGVLADMAALSLVECV